MRITAGEANTQATGDGGHDAIGRPAASTAREPRVCIRCGTVHYARRVSAPTWSNGSQGGQAPLVEWHVTLCPSCQMASTGALGGEVLLVGAFVSDHQAEIERLIRAEVSQSLEDNPPGRILRLERPQRGWLTVTTSTDRLAVRIGHTLHEVLRGTVHCEVSREHTFARVTWVRDE